jgi:chromosome segregation ATPase
MSAALVGWVAFAVAAAACVFLFVSLRSSQSARAESEAALGERGQELEGTSKRLEQRAAELRARGEELSELRKKYDKLKRRAGDEREEEKSAPARIRALESDLAAEKADSRAARDEIVRLHAELERVTAEGARATGELERATLRLAEVTPLADRGALDALSARAEGAEAKCGKLASELEAARRDAAKYKGRWETLDKAYIVLRGELELKKDETRAQRIELERLRALEVVLVEPERREPGPS